MPCTGSSPCRGACNAHPKHLPRLWERCGRREREADAGSEEQSFAAPVIATVEGTLVFGMAAPFAGRRRNEGLGRSVRRQKGLLPCRQSRRRQQGVPWAPRRGTSSACARCARTRRGGREPPRHGDTSFARSRGPCTSIVTSLRAARAVRRWRARVDIAVGKTRASGRNRHRDWHERTMRGSPRVTASRKRGCVVRQKRKEVAASVPARTRELGLFARTSYAVAEVGRRRLVPNELARSPPKRGPARVNGGLARGGRRRESVGERIERRDASPRRTTPENNGGGTGERPRVA
jgi:hypothetical protein